MPQQYFITLVVDVVSGVNTQISVQSAILKGIIPYIKFRRRLPGRNVYLTLASNNDSKPSSKTLGRRIVEARKEGRLAQQQLADQLGIVQQTLAH